MNIRSAALISSLMAPVAGFSGDLGEVPLFHPVEIDFHGPELGPADTPARDVRLAVTFEHGSGRPSVTVEGFWDGDGRGGARGRVFKVRFVPVKPGRWKLAKTSSGDDDLAGQREGDSLLCLPSSHPGFWLADGRWYRRSDGSHPFVIGNTHYSFLSRRNDRGPVASDPVADVRANAAYYRKLRFTLFGDRYPDPELKPFFDVEGHPTDDGVHSARPNPTWFYERVDPVVREAFDADLICDLILCGPDTRASRSALKDPVPWLRYVAARYGSYPNVWICLANEWNIKDPRYTSREIVEAGEAVRRFLPYPTPLSVHANSGDWDRELNGGWSDHTTIQRKLRRLERAADAAARNFEIGGRKPVVNDENAYEGDGDGFSEGDVIEGCFGTFLGGGYPTTGEKYGSKLGQYFWGGFDPRAHSASDNLRFLRKYVERHVSFWRMEPLPAAETTFRGVPASFRALGRAGEEYVLGSDRGAELEVDLPPGRWEVRRLDLVSMEKRALAAAAEGPFRFSTPDARAGLTHFRRLDDPDRERE